MAKNVTFDQPAAELIKKRFSCRSFDGRGLESKTLEALEKFPAALELPFQSRLRFGVIDGEKVKAENMFSTGSYGMIKGARFYLGALVRKEAPRPWEDIGFALEAMVLYATDLDLGSCWIGGIFDRRNFGRALGMEADELLPAVVAVGHADGPTTPCATAWCAGAPRVTCARPRPGFFLPEIGKHPCHMKNCRNGRRCWSACAWPLRRPTSSPGASFSRAGSFHFYLNRDRAYSAMMPKADLQRIDMGIAICHFQLTAAEAGLKGEWQVEAPVLQKTPPHFEYIVSFVNR